MSLWFIKLVARLPGLGGFADLVVEQIETHVINEAGHLPAAHHFGSELHLDLLPQLVFRRTLLNEFDGFLSDCVHSLLERGDVGFHHRIVAVTRNGRIEVPLQHLCH